MKSISFLLLTLLISCTAKEAIEDVQKPNLILIMTDDQGIGDFAFNANPYIQTPHLDKLASQSLNLTNFYVSPVCAPTRASLMTGRYSERTGIYDTYNGGATMSSEEITIAEILQENKYKTGIFGKWHLGDNYPYRPIDQGFDMALVHRAGGMGQPGDVYNFFSGDRSYFDPVLFENGDTVQYDGYCSDIFTDELISFIRVHRKEEPRQPFFAYLSYNAPHTPLQLPEKYYELYKDLEFNASDFESNDEATAKMRERDKEAARRVYGMVTNIDDNIGKLIRSLKEEGIYENTILVFLTDNGPQQLRYKLGLRAKKSSVYSGGIHVPCLIHYPAQMEGRSELDIPLAHIDLLPSLLDLCGLDAPQHEIDGKSFFASEDDGYSTFKERSLFFEWGRGYLQKYQNFAVLKDHFKLVGNVSMHSAIDEFELFDLSLDPGENTNILEENRDFASTLKDEMDAWYEEIIAEENNKRSFPAYVGTPYENPVILNRNDAKGFPVAWTEHTHVNYWDVKVVEEGMYDIGFHFVNPVVEIGKMCLNLYPYNIDEHFSDTGKNEWTFRNIHLIDGSYRLEPYFQRRDGSIIFPLYVSINRRD